MPACYTNADSEFLDVYEKYSPVLYGILISITNSSEEADDILIETFCNLYWDNSISKNRHCLLAHLLNTAVDIACKKHVEIVTFTEKISALPKFYRLLLSNPHYYYVFNAPNDFLESGKELSCELKRLTVK